MKNSLLLPALVSLLLSSCAGTFTAAQKEQMTSIHLPGTVTKPEAYLPPNYTSASDRATSDAMSAGLGFGLLGALASEIATGIDRAADAKKHRASADALAKRPPANLDRVFSQELRKLLGQSLFFGPKLTSNTNAPARLNTVIRSFQLASVDDLLFTPVIVIDTDFLINGQSVRKKTYTSVSDARMLHTSGLGPVRDSLENYAADSKRLQSHFEETTRRLAVQIAQDLGKAAVPK